MDVKLAAALAGAVRRGEVAGFCRTNGISRETFYKWRRRAAAAGGVLGLEELSRRPLRSPNQTPVDVEDAIVRARKELDDVGWDNGPWSVRQRLLKLTVVGVPSEATIWRILVRRGLITPEPKKRPKNTWHRFVWDRSNDLWQIDATHWALADGRPVEIINIIDDHSRVCPRSLAVWTCTSPMAWKAVEQGAGGWGLPARMLSDNGIAFNQSRRNTTSLLELNLRRLGVLPIASM
ncbi:MAG: helix-turn-helix domain-containing protein, partial [Actinomycetota bacterium]|nr:helix-turn-helix domain-containing protein [Actinomycetota bacterium]